MSRLARPAARLATGSSLVVRRLGARAAAWCARGRRHDLTGFAAILGNLVRATVLVIAAVAVCVVVRRRPWLMWLLTGWWTFAAWRAGKPTEGDQAEEPEEAPPEHTSDQVLAATLEWIRQRIGDRQGVHLRDLLTHAQQHGMFEDLEVTDLRAHLERWGIPVRDRQRVRGLGVTVGIHRDDLPAPSGPSPASTPQEAPDLEPQAN